MSLQSLTTALTLYRSGTLDLDQAARQGGVSTAKLATELRSRAIPVREGEHGGATDQAAN
jgi:predicted HTH domain antitoxin